MSYEPGSPEWLRLITASKVAPIVGKSVWTSPFKMYHQMLGNIPPDAETDAMRRGNLLESAILQWWRNEHPEYDDCHEQQQFWLDERQRPTWAMATPDMIAHGAGLPTVVVEAKSVAHMDDWGFAGTDAIPVYYRCQTQFQMHLSGLKTAYVPIIGPGLDFSEYVVQYDESEALELIAKCAEFYALLNLETAPPLDDSLATYKALRELNPDISLGEFIVIEPDLAVEYLQALESEKAAGGRATRAKSEILDLMGKSQFAFSNDVCVAKRKPNRYNVHLERVAKSADIFLSMMQE